MTAQADDRVLVVIPARWESSRFPGKALADLGGRPLVVRTAEAAARMTVADRVVVATDDRRIADAVAAAGLEAVLTAVHPTGTDRVGEVARADGAAVVLNLQGDEPLLDPADADRLVAALRADPRADLATCGHPFADEAAWRDPNQVKVLRGADGGALSFSRAPIPGMFPGSTVEPWRLALRHVGIYAYRRPALERFLALAPTALERCEGLEQLRALEYGLRILVTDIAAAPVGVDTPEDLEAVRRLWAARTAGNDI
jgi:3-deoxy-manno-octulosonate cytidylyltransferase (CMP-KDO synthetase)